MGRGRSGLRLLLVLLLLLALLLLLVALCFNPEQLGFAPGDFLQFLLFLLLVFLLGLLLLGRTEFLFLSVQKFDDAVCITHLLPLDQSYTTCTYRWVSSLLDWLGDDWLE